MFGKSLTSIDGGRLAVVPLEATNRVAVSHHAIEHVVLENGAALDISALHPTADGRTFGDLRPGDRLDGLSIREITLAPYAHEFTYDILPASDSGAYFAGGVLIGSKLAKQAVLQRDVTAPMSR